MSESHAYNRDCMDALKEFPDKFFDLCIADPPYGISASEMQMGKGKHKRYEQGLRWDSTPPSKEVFAEVIRISKKAIIWGGNYFDLPKTDAWLIWDKGLYGKTTFADCEMAWTNIETKARIVQCRYDGFLGADPDGRIHITQKPIRLYEMLIRMFGKDSKSMIDPFLGSGSSRIAAYNAGLDFWGYEIDKIYFNLQEERFARHVAQQNLFLMEGL